MKINKALNLVIPVQRDDGEVFVHAMPISREVFERYFLVISKTFARIYGEGLNLIAGPRIAGLMLKQVATEMGVWDGADGIEIGLMSEIRRLANVVLPGVKGWETIPLQEALDKKYFDADDVSEIEGAIVFFILVSAMHKKAEIQDFMSGIEHLWGTRSELSNCTAFAASLPISTATETLAPTAASSVPS